MITDPAFSSPFLPRLTWKRGEKAVYFQVPGYQGIGVIPRLEIGWLAFKSSPFLPRETGKKGIFSSLKQTRRRMGSRSGGFQKIPISSPWKGIFPVFPQKRKIGNPWKKCYNVPNLSVKCLKTWNCEAQSECPNTARRSIKAQSLPSGSWRFPRQ